VDVKIEFSTLGIRLNLPLFVATTVVVVTLDHAFGCALDGHRVMGAFNKEARMLVTPLEEERFIAKLVCIVKLACAV